MAQESGVVLRAGLGLGLRVGVLLRAGVAAGVAFIYLVQGWPEVYKEVKWFSLTYYPVDIMSLTFAFLADFTKFQHLAPLPVAKL